MANSIFDDLRERLPEFRREHERLGKLIAMLEGDDAEGEYVDVSPDGRAILPDAARKRSASNAPIASDDFFNMNTHQAVKAFLARMGKGNPQGPKEIAQALVSGGQGSDAEKVYINVTSGLKRMSGQPDGVVQVRRGKWGLASWYPGGVKKRETTKAEEKNGAGE